MKCKLWRHATQYLRCSLTHIFFSWTWIHTHTRTHTLPKYCISHAKLATIHFMWNKVSAFKQYKYCFGPL